MNSIVKTKIQKGFALIFNFLVKENLFLVRNQDKINSNSLINYPQTTNINGLSLQIRKPLKEIYLKIGENSVVQGTFVVETENGKISIGDRTFIGASKFICTKEIEIGNDVLISWGCTVIDSNSHSHIWSERKNDVMDWKKGIDENSIGK